MILGDCAFGEVTCAVGCSAMCSWLVITHHFAGVAGMLLVACPSHRPLFPGSWCACPPPPTPRPTGPSSPLSRLPATLQPPMAGVVSVWEVCAHLPDQTTPPRPGRGGIGRKLLQDGCPPSPLKRGDSLISPPVTLFWCFGRPWGEVVFRIDFFIKKTLTECGLPGGFLAKYY